MDEILGREEQIRELTELFDSAGIVALVGAAGIGKSALAQAILRRFAPRFPGRAWAFSLEQSEPDLLAGYVARSVGATADGPDPISDAISAIGSEPALMIVDDCDVCSAEVDAMAERLRLGCSQLRILVVSRRPFLTRPDAVLALGALAVGPGSPAVQLFERVTSAARIGTDDDWGPDEMAAVCEAVGGVPLAIILAAGRSRLLSPVQLLARLREAGAPARQSDPVMDIVHEVTRWSFDAAGEEEQSAWLKLAVLDGPFTVECASYVIESGAETILGELVDSGVAAIDNTDGARTVRLSEVARAFGRTSSRFEQGLVEERVVEYVKMLADHAIADTLTERQAGWASLADAEHATVRFAAGACLRRSDLREFAFDVLILGFRGLWWAAGYGAEAAHWSVRLLGILPAGDLLRGFVMTLAIGYSTAVELNVSRLAEMREIAADHSSDDLKDLVDYSAAISTTRLGELEVANASAASILRRRDHDRRSTAYLDALQAQSDALFCGDDLAGAKDAAVAILAIVEPLGEFWYRTLALRILALVRLRLGLVDEALELARQALTVSIAGQCRTPIYAALQTIAIVYSRRGMPRLAALLEGFVSVRATSVAMSRGVLTTAGDLPQMRASLRSDLGAKSYSRFVSEGERTSLQAVEQLALDGRELEVVSPAIAAGLDSLTARERQVAAFVAQGATNKQIAEALFVSSRTVEAHVAHALRKLDLKSRSQLAATVLATKLSDVA